MKRRTDGNVIHADFGGRDRRDMSIRITSEVLYHDDRVMLTRATLTLGAAEAVNHFIAYRKGDGLEVIPVDA